MKYIYLYFLVLLVPAICCGQDSLNMSLVAHWDDNTIPPQSGVQYNDIWGYVDCSGNEYAILGSARYVHFIRIDASGELEETGRFPGTSGSIWRDMKTYRDRAYAVAQQGSDGLMVFDLSGLPDSIRQSNMTTQYFQRCHNIYIDETNGRLYVVGANTQSNGVIILDLTANPDEPALLASIPLPGGYVHDIHVVDNIGYCSHGGTGLFVYDFSDPANPQTLGTLTSYPESGYNHSSWLHEDGELLVFADETHGKSLKLADVSDLTDITVLNLFKSALLAPANEGSIGHNPFIRDEYAVVSYYHDGIQVFDLSDPDDIVRVAYYDTYPFNTAYDGFDGAWGAYPFLPSGRILGSDTEFGLFVLSADNISFDPIMAAMTPTAMIESDSDPMLCEGSSLNLSAAGGTAQYTWLKDGGVIAEDVAGITVTEAGEYQLLAADGYCEAASSPLSVSVTPLPDVELPSSSLVLCEGQTKIITAPAGADTYSWYLNEAFFIETENNQLELSEAGIYQLVASTNQCADTSETLEISIAVLPDISFLPGTVDLCEGESAQLDIPDMPGVELYRWYRNGELISESNENGDIALEQEGTYQLEIVMMGCSGFSDNIELNVRDLPQFELGYPAQQTVCEGEEVTLLIEGQEAYTYLLLLPSQESVSIMPGHILQAETGNYRIIAFNEFCESEPQFFDITVLIPDVPGIGQAGNTLTATPAQTYQWYLDGQPISGAVDQSWEAQASGLYFVETTDENGCMARSEEVQVIITAVKALEKGTLKIFPNPAGSNVHIRLLDPANKLKTITLKSINGEQILEVIPEGNTHTLRLATLPRGVYLLRVRTEKGEKVAILNLI